MDHQASTPRELTSAAVGTQTLPPRDEPEALSLQQLRRAVSELFVALNETLRDERGKAAERLTRAEVLLEAPHMPERAPAAFSAGLAPWQVRRVTTHVDANLNVSIRNKELAEIARLSEFHFNVAFRKCFGQSPHEYIMRRRVARAQGLMLSTNMALSAIAFECGLADQSHLTRLFRRFSGESPAAWRRTRINPL